MKERKQLHVKDKTGAYIVLYEGDRVVKEKTIYTGAMGTDVSTVQLSGTVVATTKGMSTTWQILWDDRQHSPLKEGDMVCKQ